MPSLDSIYPQLETICDLLIDGYSATRDDLEEYWGHIEEHPAWEDGGTAAVLDAFNQEHPEPGDEEEEEDFNIDRTRRLLERAKAYESCLDAIRPALPIKHQGVISHMQESDTTQPRSQTWRGLLKNVSITEDKTTGKTEVEVLLMPMERLRDFPGHVILFRGQTGDRAVRSAANLEQALVDGLIVTITGHQEVINGFSWVNIGELVEVERPEAGANRSAIAIPAKVAGEGDRR